MLLPGVAEVEISQFQGSMPRLEPYQIPLNKAIYAQNVAYVNGQVGTRYGHSALYSLSDGAITAMGNWFFTFSGTPVSVVAYYAPATGVRTLNQSGATVATVMAVTGAAGAVMVPTGERLYVAFYNSTGRIGSAGGQVYGWNVGADPLFAAPITNSTAVSETGAGVITAGTHRIGFLATTRNGYTMKLCPVTGGGTFNPTSFASTGLKNLQVQITGSIPSYLTGGTIQVVMTTVANPNKYFTVPGATTIATNPTTLTISISDDDLAATGQDVTQYQNLLTCSVGGTPPFNPVSIFPYSSRMGYIGIDSAGFPFIGFSEPSAFQYLTADQHLITIEGQQQGVVGFSLRGVAYIACTSGFYSVEDNGDVPVTWTPPQRVDGSVSVLSPTNVLNNPAAGYALVASERGFYLFQGGIFPPLPLSYYQNSDWARINWNLSTQVQIGDDQANKRFLVSAPLNTTITAVTVISGGFRITTGEMPPQYAIGMQVTLTGVNTTVTISAATLTTFDVLVSGHGTPTVGGTVAPTTASHQMTWDYTEGDTPDTVKYSINSFAGYAAASVTTIRNLTTLLNEIWYGAAQSSAAAIIRQNDGTEANPYRDVDLNNAATLINCPYETALVPEPLVGGMTIHDYDGCHMAVRGVGNLNMLAKGLNGGVVVVPTKSPVALALNPTKETLVKWYLRNERQSFRVSTSAIDSYYILSLIRLYYTDAFPQR